MNSKFDFHTSQVMRDISINYMTPPPTQFRFTRRNSVVFDFGQDPFEKYQIDDNIMRNIFDFLPMRDLNACLCVSRKFHRVAVSPRFWKTVAITKSTVSGAAIHNLLARDVKHFQMNAPSAVHFPLIPFLPIPDFYDKLTFLDLNNVTYSDPLCLPSILEKTCSLQILNIAYYPNLDEETCAYIAQNKSLFSLNIEYCKGITIEGVAELCQCEELEELNMGWVGINSGAVVYLSRNLPPGLRALNLAGRCFRDLTDDLVVNLLQSCFDLEELDISDCPEITENILQELVAHETLKHLSLSRCYGIDPVRLTELEGLETLNIFGCVTDEGVNYLKEQLSPTSINKHPLCDIARSGLSKMND